MLFNIIFIVVITGVQGLCLGILLGAAATDASFHFLMWRTDWSLEADKAAERAGVNTLRGSADVSFERVGVNTLSGSADVSLETVGVSTLSGSADVSLERVGVGVKLLNGSADVSLGSIASLPMQEMTDSFEQQSAEAETAQLLAGHYQRVNISTTSML